MIKALFYTFCLINLCFFTMCEREETERTLDLSGTYSDTINYLRTNGTYGDTVILKEVLRVNDSTYKLKRFFGGLNDCDSSLIILRTDSTLKVPLHGKVNHCIVLGNNYGNISGFGYFSPSRNYLWVSHLFVIGGGQGPGPGLGVERMKKL